MRQHAPNHPRRPPHPVPTCEFTRQVPRLAPLPGNRASPEIGSAFCSSSVVPFTSNSSTLLTVHSLPPSLGISKTFAKIAMSKKAHPSAAIRRIVQAAEASGVVELSAPTDTGSQREDAGLAAKSCRFGAVSDSPEPDLTLVRRSTPTPVEPSHRSAPSGRRKWANPAGYG